MRCSRSGPSLLLVWLCVTLGLGAVPGAAAGNELSGRDGAGTRFFVDGASARVTVAKRLVRRRMMRVTCVELVGAGMSSAYAELVTRRFVGRAGQRRWTVRFSRDASRLINRCGLLTGTRDLDLTDGDTGTAMRRLKGPPPGCRTGRREDLVAATSAVRVMQVQGLVLRICHPGDARPITVDNFYGDLHYLHGWRSPIAVGNTVVWVAVDGSLGNDSLSVNARIGESRAEHRIDYVRLGSGDYDVLQLAATETGAYALVVHHNVADHDALYAGRLAADTGATLDEQPSGVIAGIGVTDDAVTWIVNGQQRAAMLP